MTYRIHSTAHLVLTAVLVLVNSGGAMAQDRSRQITEGGETTPSVEKLRVILDRAEEALNMADIEKGYKILDEAISAQKAANDQPTDEVLAILVRFTTMAREYEFTKQASEFKNQAIKIGQQLKGENNYQAKDLELALDELVAARNRAYEQRERAREIEREATTASLRGDYARAAEFGRQLVSTYEGMYGKAHPFYADSLFRLGSAYRDMGEYARAEPLYRECMAIRKNAWGKEHPQYALVLNKLGSLYQDMGRFSRAETLHLEAQAISEKFRDQDPRGYALSLSSLARLYQSIGEFARAEPLLVECNEIRKKLLGTRHGTLDEHATSLNNLGKLYSDMGRTKRAESFFLESKAISEKIGQKEHPAYATTLNNLALVYEAMGRFSHAESLHVEAKEIREKVLGKQHAAYANSLNNLAKLYESIGEFSRAIPMHLEAMAITERARGKEHLYFASSLESLAVVYRLTGESPLAKRAAIEAVGLRVSTASMTIPALSEAQAMRWVRTQRPLAGLFLSILRDERKSIDRDVEAYGLIWKTKSLARRLRISHRISPEASPQAKQAFGELLDARLKLARLVSATPESEHAEQFQRELSELNEQKERFEKRLASLNPATKQALAIRDASVDDFLNRLPSGVAVVDISRLSDWRITKEEITLERTDGSQESREVSRFSRVPVYDAFVLRSTADPMPSTKWVELGDAKPIDRVARRWRGQLERASGDAESSGKTLWDFVWKKIQPHLVGCHTVILLPDGELNRVPWAALPGRNPGSHLLQDYALATCSYGQRLFGLLSGESPSGQQLLLAGGIDYDRRGTSTSPNSFHSSPLLLAEKHRGLPTRNGDAKWKFLPGTEKEVETIEQAWNDRGAVISLTGDAASETTVASALSRSRFAHLATHGFFAAPEVKDLFHVNLRKRSLFQSVDARGATVAGRNPLLLCGLVVSGVNLPTETSELGIPVGEDGILTAEEIAGLDLSGTEMVTLSACETALGDLAAGEGVFGLQRAFHQAGARCVVASLWKVSDAATQTLMTDFYENLWQKRMGKLESLRQAQLKMIRDYDPNTGRMRGLGTKSVKLAPNNVNDAPAPRNRLHPNYWAAFQLSGDWR